MTPRIDRMLAFADYLEPQDDLHRERGAQSSREAANYLRESMAELFGVHPDDLESEHGY